VVDGALTTFFRGRWAILHMTVGEKPPGRRCSWRVIAAGKQAPPGSKRRQGADAAAERRGQGADAAAKKGDGEENRCPGVRGGRALRQLAEEARLRNEQGALPGKRALYREINTCQATSMGCRKLIISVG